MGKIKELMIDLQNEYGKDLEDMPNGFDFEAYLEMRANEPSSGDDTGKETLFCHFVKSRK
jgi:hypothetical protein